MRGRILRSLSVAIAGAMLGHAVVVHAEADATTPNFQDIRFLGRGNTGIAVVQDSTAAFYNPAGIGAIKSIQANLFNPVLGGHENFYSSYKEIAHFGSGSTTLSDKFAPFLGHPLGLQGSYFPSIAIPNFVLGYAYVVDGRVNMRNPVFPELDVNYRYDKTLVMGTGYSYKNWLNFGTSIRYVRRQTLNAVYDASVLTSATTALLTDSMQKGEGYALNLGMQARQPVGKMSWVAMGLTMDDVGMTPFKTNNPLARPPRQAQSVNLGLAGGVKVGALAEFKLLADFHRLDHNDESFTKKAFIGTEFGLLVWDFRAGLYQGYWTLGFSWKILPFLALDLATYASEADSAAGLHGDRVWMLGLSMPLELKNNKKTQKFKLDKL